MSDGETPGSRAPVFPAGEGSLGRVHRDPWGTAAWRRFRASHPTLAGRALPRAYSDRGRRLLLAAIRQHGIDDYCLNDQRIPDLDADLRRRAW